jgi:hypothetical protein
MTVSPEQFKQFIIKLAQSDLETNEDSTLRGQQGDEVPALLQPDEGPGEGPRSEVESLSTGAEKESKQNEQGYLLDILNNYLSASKQTSNELKSLLDSYGPDAISSSSVAKTGSIKVASFIDELAKISQKINGVAK